MTAPGRSDRAAGGLAASPCPTAPPPRRWALLLAAALAVIYLFGVSFQWWPTPDSALYQSLGRSLAAGEGYRFNGAVCNSVTPGLPLLLAGARRALGGLYGEWAPNLLMALGGLGFLAVVYAAYARREGRAVALAVAGICGLSYSVFLHSHQVLTDIPFALVFWGVVYAAGRAAGGGWRWPTLAAGLTLAGLVIRIPGAVVLGPLALGLLLDRPAGLPRRRSLAAGAVVLLTVLAALAAGYLLARRVAPDVLYADALSRRLGLDEAGAAGGAWRAGGGLGAVLWRQGGDVAAGLAKLPEVYAEMLTSQSGFLFLGGPLLALSAAGALLLWRRGRRSELLLLLLVPAALAVLGATRHVRARYLLPILPVIVHCALVGLLWQVRAARRWSPRRRGVVAGVLAAAALAGGGLALLRGSGLFDAPQSLALGALLYAALILAAGRSTSPLPRAELAATLALAGLLMACNVPRVFRDAFYLGHLGHTQRYYQVLRDGRFKHLPDAVAATVGATGPDDVVATNYEMSIVHYLTGRVVLSLPDEPADVESGSDYARRIARRLRRAGAVQAVFIQSRHAGDGFVEVIDAQLSALGMVSRYAREPFRLYVRAAETPGATASAPAAP